MLTLSESTQQDMYLYNVIRAHSPTNTMRMRIPLLLVKSSDST